MPRTNDNWSTILVWYHIRGPSGDSGTMDSLHWVRAVLGSGLWKENGKRKCWHQTPNRSYHVEQTKPHKVRTEVSN